MAAIPTKDEIRLFLRAHTKRLEEKGYSIDEVHACVREFAAREEAYLEAARSFTNRLLAASSLADALHSVRMRPKNKYRLIDKLRRKCLDEKDPRTITTANLFDLHEGVTDLAGVRILHLYKDQWLPIHGFLTNEDELPGFQLCEKTAHIRAGDSPAPYRKAFETKEIKANQRRYTSLHYIFRWTASRIYSDIYLECQVRTLFEEGWGEIDHQRRYPHGSNELVDTQLRILDKATDIADDIARGLRQLDRFPLFVPWDMELEYERASDRVLVLSHDLRWVASHLSNIVQQLEWSDVSYVYYVPRLSTSANLRRNHDKVMRTIKKRGFADRFKVKEVTVDFRLPIFSDLLLLEGTVDPSALVTRSLGVLGAPYGKTPAPDERFDMLISSREEVETLEQFFENLEPAA